MPRIIGVDPINVGTSVFSPASLVPVGTVLPFTGPSAPTGYLLAYGQAVSRTTYATYFALVGTTYGVGDGVNTFNMPDLRGRAIFGKDDMGGVAANRITNAISAIVGTSLGATGGSEILHQHNHGATGLSSSAPNLTSLTLGTETANHTHTDSGHNHAINNAGIAGISNTGSGATAHFYWTTSPGYTSSLGYASLDTQSVNHTHNLLSATLSAPTISGSTANAGTGGSQNMPPAIVLNYIIKV